MSTNERAQGISGKGEGRARRRAEAAPAVGRRLDVATILGLSGGLLLIATAIVLGGSASAFVDGAALLIVIGGTFAVTTICFSVEEIIKAQAVILNTLFHPAGEPQEAAIRILKLAETARTDGVLTLQKLVKSFRHAPFLQQAVSLVIDGVPGDEVERILSNELAAMRVRHAKGANVLRKAAEVSPAMGLIGTLVGLVQMLGNLDDPSAIGPGMAVALLTTFYGAVLANLVFAPLAAKLERNSAEEILLNRVYMMGASSISRLENPRRLEMLLNAVLPPAQRLRYFD